MTENWTVRQILNWTIEYFTSQNIPEPRLSAELLLASALDCQRIDLYLQFERMLTKEERTGYREYVQRRAKREPIQYILGETEFWGFPLKVSPQVLIPRHDTELLVDSAVEFIENLEDEKDLSILDIGTGSGCIAIALARNFPVAKVYAVDKSKESLAIARENAELNQANIQFFSGNFFEEFRNIPLPCHVLVANPPYISTSEWPTLSDEIRLYEPSDALLDGADGLDFYRHLAPLLKNIVIKGGAVFLETGYQQAHQVSKIFQSENFVTEIRKDYQHHERVVIVQYPEN